MIFKKKHKLTLANLMEQSQAHQTILQLMFSGQFRTIGEAVQYIKQHYPEHYSYISKEKLPKKQVAGVLSSNLLDAESRGAENLKALADYEHTGTSLFDDSAKAKKQPKKMG